MSRFAAIVLAIVFSMPVYASWTGVNLIDSLKVQSNGVVIVSLEGFSGNSQDCADDRFMMSSSDGSYDQRLSVLMASYMGGKPVRFSYYGCDGDYIKLGSVEFR